MSTSPVLPRVALRRAFSALVAVTALLLLAAVGRYALGSATPLPPADPSASRAATDADAATVDDASNSPEAALTPVDAPSDSNDPAERPSSAVELLGDGGILVDLNLANEEDLRRLPGVGPVRAREILELRRRLGRIKSVDDLARIKGFGRATLRRLRPLTRT